MEQIWYDKEAKMDFICKQMFLKTLSVGVPDPTGGFECFPAPRPLSRGKLCPSRPSPNLLEYALTPTLVMPLLFVLKI